jgi:excinuclease ABC subunit B
MGIALYHEVEPHRPGAKRGKRYSPLTSPGEQSDDAGKPPSRSRPHYPDLDSMGPGTESAPAGRTPPQGPRSTMGRPGMRGGFKRRGR